MTVRIDLRDEAATTAFGDGLAKALPADTTGWLISLKGELGAGKTTLARALLEGLGHTGPVPSPTYTLVEPYTLGSRRVFHVDLYRIGDEAELEFLGWDDLREGLILLEWPERAPGASAAADLAIGLSYAGAGRAASLGAATERGERWLQGAQGRLAQGLK